MVLQGGRSSGEAVICPIAQIRVALPKPNTITALNRSEEPPLSPAIHPRLRIGHRECRDAFGITSRRSIDAPIGV